MYLEWKQESQFDDSGLIAPPCSALLLPPFPFFPPFLPSSRVTCCDFAGATSGEVSYFENRDSRREEERRECKRYSLCRRAARERKRERGRHDKGQSLFFSLEPETRPDVTFSHPLQFSFTLSNYFLHQHTFSDPRICQVLCSRMSLCPEVSISWNHTGPGFRIHIPELQTMPNLGIQWFCNVQNSSVGHQCHHPAASRRCCALQKFQLHVAQPPPPLRRTRRVCNFFLHITTVREMTCRFSES